MKFLQEAAAFLLAALLTLGLAMAAYSAESDPSQRASVTIHKLLVEEGKTLAVDQDGREITDPGGLYVYQNDGKTTLKDLKGLNGVGFTLTRVRDGTASVNNTVKHTGADAYENTLTTARVGGRDGIAKFDNLPHGVYLVEEIKSGDYKAGTVKFLLQVPLPDPTGSGEYIYDIHVYPKNTGGPGDGTRSKEFTKEVGKRTGNDVTWEFKWNIPDGIADGESLTLTDELDDRLTYKSVSVGYQNRSGSDKTLATRYYEVNYDKRDHTVAITLKDDGFAELAKALLPESGKKTPTLIIRLNTTIKSNATGTIKNSGVLEYTDGDGKTTTETPKKDPTVDVENGEGSLTIYKYDDKTKEPLSGAQFKLYTSRSDALADRNAVRISGDTTGSDGYLLIEGLEYEGKGTSYWLMETKAPVVGDKQYQLLPAPMEVRVGPSSHLRSNWVEVPNNVDLTKGNDGPPDGPGSPYGGGAGRWPFTLAGLLLIAWSAGMLARWRRNGMK